MHHMPKPLKIIPMPAACILGLVNNILQASPLQKPITMEVLLRAKDKYLRDAALLN